MRPNVGAIAGDKDGNIPDDAYSLFGGVGAQSRPLTEKEELAKGMALHGLGMYLTGPEQGLGVSKTQRGGPVVPRGAFMGFFESHKQSKIIQPGGLSSLKSGKLGAQRR